MNKFLEFQQNGYLYRINEECLNNAKKALEKVNKLDNRIIDLCEFSYI